MTGIESMEGKDGMELKTLRNITTQKSSFYSILWIEEEGCTYKEIKVVEIQLFCFVLCSLHIESSYECVEFRRLTAWCPSSSPALGCEPTSPVSPTIVHSDGTSLFPLYNSCAQIAFTQTATPTNQRLSFPSRTSATRKRKNYNNEAKIASISIISYVYGRIAFTSASGHTI